MSTRVAAWILLGIALVCGLGGVVVASTFLDAGRFGPSELGHVVRNAMVATVFLVCAGGAVIGLVVLRGVAEMLDQVVTAVDQTGPTTGGS